MSTSLTNLTNFFGNRLQQTVKLVLDDTAAAILHVLRHGDRVRHGGQDLAAGALWQVSAGALHGGCRVIADWDGCGQRSRYALCTWQVSWGGWKKQCREGNVHGKQMGDRVGAEQHFKVCHTWSNVTQRLQPIGGHLKREKIQDRVSFLFSHQACNLTLRQQHLPLLWVRKTPHGPPRLWMWTPSVGWRKPYGPSDPVYWPDPGPVHSPVCPGRWITKTRPHLPKTSFTQKKNYEKHNLVHKVVT